MEDKVKSFKLIAKISLSICILFCTCFDHSVSAESSAELSNKPIHWGFKKNTDHTPPSAGQQLDELLSAYGSFYLGNTNHKYIYFTFDNGYENGYTPSILDTLQAKQVPATFFVTGHYLTDQPDLVLRMVEDGHIVGNHSWSHPDMTSISYGQTKKELEQVEQAFHELTGVKGMSYLRAPRGVFSEQTLAVTAQLGYRNVFWSLAFVDWNIHQQKGWEYAYDQIMNHIHPGAVILMHTVSSDNAEALPKVIDDLQQQGYIFKSLDDVTDPLHLTTIQT